MPSHNQQVKQNIARLLHIAQQDLPHEALLAQLHPWRGYPSLRFHNGLSILIAIIVSLLLLASVIGLLTPEQSQWSLMGFIAALALALWGYYQHEAQSQITQTVTALEEDVIRSLYQVQQGHLPEQHILPLRSSMLMSQLQILFPIFQQGDHSNNIHSYAATTWYGRHEQAFPVLLFHYHFVNKTEANDEHGKTWLRTEQHQDRWGALIFNSTVQGIAVSNLSRLQRPAFEQVYPHAWQTSDINSNQNLYIRCQDPMQAAKALPPAAVLALAQLFQQHQGVVMAHNNQNIICFLGNKALLQHTKKRGNIHDVSQLRGHLRTFRLYPYEQLQRAIKVLLHE